MVTGNIGKGRRYLPALDTGLSALAQLPHIYLAGAIYPNTGEYAKAIEHGKEATRLSPNFSPSYALPMFDYIALNRLDEAKATYEQAIERKLKNGLFPLLLYQIAFLQNDTAGMAQQGSIVGGHAGSRGLAAGLGSRYRGLFRAAQGGTGVFPPGDGFRRTGRGRRSCCNVLRRVWSA